MEISRNTKPEHEIPSSSYIPEWFLLEILFKLPSKSVIRFKCLSKQVLALTSEPSFIRDYISRASSKPLPWTFVARDMLPAAQADLQPCGGERVDNHFERNLSGSSQFKSTPISKLVTPCSSMENCKVLAISNGLCLCSWEENREYSETYSIFNPVTKQSIVLPGSRGIPKVGPMAFHAHVDQVGVVIYKVERLLFEEGAPPTDLLVEGLYSKTYKWTSFTAHFPEPIYSFCFSMPFSFKGKFHWVDELAYNGSCRIISYDPVHIIRCPGTGKIIWCDAIMSAGGEQTIRSIKHDYYKSLFYVWRLKDYEQGIWELEHKFSSSDVLLPCADNKMIACVALMNVALHPAKPDLLSFWGQTEEEVWMLVSFNLCSRKSRVSDTISRVYCPPGFLNTPYVLPPWPAILPHPSQ